MFKQLKNSFFNIIQSRYFILTAVFIMLACVMTGRLFYLQIVKGDEYLSNFTLQIQKTQEIKSTRGNIYDRNGNLLAYNELAYSVTIEDNGAFDDLTDAEKNNALNNNIMDLLAILDNNGDTTVTYFDIFLDEDGNYAFSDDAGTTRNRFIADVYGEKSFNDLTDDKKNADPNTIMTYMCSSKRYNIDEEAVGKEMALRIVNIRYAMSSISYSKYLVTTVAKDVSSNTVAAVKENSDILTGVDIAEEALRRYTDAAYFSNVIGYTGVISAEEYDTLSAQNSNYSLNDIIGKSGIEQVMDTQLQGTKGQKTFYVDSVGNILQTTEVKDPVVGNDLYLSIDKNLQESVYHILEQKLAGIIVSKLTPAMEYDPHNAGGETSNIAIPIGKVYTAFFENMILDITSISTASEGTAQYAVYQSFLQRQDSAVGSVISELNSPTAAYTDLSDEMRAYFTYIVDTVLKKNSGILDTNRIDTSDATYQAWNNDGTISLRDFLNYAISKDWIDTSKLSELKSSSQYSDSNEIISSIISYLDTELRNDRKFSRIIYKYMTLDGTISGEQICLMIYEQGILPEDNATVEQLSTGALSPYAFFVNKISSLEITPAMLALEPCTASCVITDPDSGQVLACVSYPGYDSNRLANTMDSAYYNKLVNDGSHPLYNSATQERTAPGSTYKMLTSLAGLESGTITTETGVYCTGEFDKIKPSPKCWVYPGGHGYMTVVSAIANSCNDFFYEVGYDLGLDASGNYSSDRGISVLTKYAEEFGFDSTSGIEIPESSPQISNTDSVRSAIGQGTNNYTISQMARYVTAVSNQGTVYNLSLLDKLVSQDGTILEEYTPTVKNTINAKTSTWNAITQGMENMVLRDATFATLTSTGFSMCGKTGTAQQSEIHPDHVLFVGFAPATDPKIALAIRIANGYSSTYAAQVGRDIVTYYFNLEDSSSIVNGSAADVGTVTTGD